MDRSPAVSRRGLLIAGGALAGVLVACTGSSRPPAPIPTTTPTTTPGPDQPSGDLAVALLAASLENTLDATYASVLDLAAAGKLGVLPPALTTLVQTVQSQHRDHAAAWNAILTGAGDSATTAPDRTLFAEVVQAALPALRDVDGVLALALQIEQVAAATYLDAVQHTLTTTGAIQTAAAIQPVEMQHISILSLFTASAPIPGSFATTTGARTTSDQLG